MHGTALIASVDAIEWQGQLSEEELMLTAIFPLQIAQSVSQVVNNSADFHQVCPDMLWANLTETFFFQNSQIVPTPRPRSRPTEFQHSQVNA